MNDTIPHKSIETKKLSKDENPLLNLLFNVVIPAIILIKLGKKDYLGPIWGLVAALSFPVIYGVYDGIYRKKFNFISALGFFSILLTGGIGLLKINKDWIPIKEASVPALIGIVVLASLFFKSDFVKKLLFQEKIFEVENISQQIEAQNKQESFNKLFKQITLIFAASFFLSSVLNYALAKWIIVSETGTEAFTEELGKMTALSYPVIVLPSMIIMFFALWWLIHGLKKLTGWELKHILKGLEEAENNK